MRKKKKSMNAAELMVIGFFVAIVLGGLLLWLPVSQNPGQRIPFIDCLFTSTTSLCVTGLVTVPTFSSWSTVGHLIIMLLIQLGGLGVVTFSTMVFILFGKKITIRERKMIQDTYNLDTMTGMVKVVYKVVICILAAEAIGALFYAFEFVPAYGLGKGLWYSVFHAVSGFCNAGIDILGPDSLRTYISNPLVNITTMGLIVVSGIGFCVWWDVGGTIRKAYRKEIVWRQFWQKLQLHTKLALMTTLILIIGGAFLIFLFEFGNPKSFGDLSLGDKVMASLFQSITTRTAGFETVAQADLTDASCLVSMILMFIGGSPMGTAGGVKTTTVAVIFLTTLAYFRGKKTTDAFHRQIITDNVRTAVVVVVTGFSCVLLMVLFLSTVTGGDFMDVCYEILSALGTVGLTRGFTPNLPLIGKIIVIISMYLGRIGPITLVSVVVSRSREANTSIERAKKRVLIG